MHTVPLTDWATGCGSLHADADEPVSFKATTAGAAARTFPIGKLVDSADDTARLMIVNQYAGSSTVKVYNEGERRYDEYWHEGGLPHHPGWRL